MAVDDDEPTRLVEGYFAALDDGARRAIAKLDAAEQHHFRRFAYLLSEWAGLPGKLAPGEELYIYEYVNYLDIRDSLECLRGRLPASAVTAYDALLTQLDERFTAVTAPDNTGVLRNQRSVKFPDTSPPPWWMRCPRAITLME